LQLVQQPPPPISFDSEIAQTRSMAEQRVGIPDFGVGDPNQPGAKNKTATETNVITNVMQQSNDLRARILKGALTKVFEQSWSLLIQYKRNSLDYFWRNQRLTLEDAAFDNKYVLKPNGSVDGYSREKEIQKLMQLRQLAQGSPWIQVPEIDRKIIELMDAQWISDIYQPPQEMQADQQEQQAIENSIMMDGFLPPVKPNDDHVIHMQIGDGFIGWKAQHGQPIPPDVMQIFMQHLQMHIQAARSNPQYMAAHGQDVISFEQKLKATQRQMQQQQQAQQKAAAAMAALRGGAGAPPGMPPPVPGMAPGAPGMGPGMPGAAGAMPPPPVPGAPPPPIPGNPPAGPNGQPPL
jgi:hypothetical protein